MLGRRSIASLFMGGGVLLGVLGLALWLLLPIRLSCPPFLVTALLALGYGAFSARWKVPPPPLPMAKDGA